MKIFLFLFIFGAAPSWAGKVLDEFVNVNPYSLPGDTDRNHLPVAGVRFHESNDLYGKTDKLISEAASISVMDSWKKFFASSLSYKGRYLQPIIRTRNTEAPLETPIGIHAEWIELSFDQSVTLFNDDSWVALKLDGGLGYNDFGDHHFSDIYKRAHTIFGGDDELDNFGERLEDNFISSTMAAALIFPFGDVFNLMTSYQIMNSKIFREDSQEISLVWRISKKIAVSTKYSFVNQIRSEFYHLRHYRTQYSVAARLFEVWTPSIMYVTPYVRGDKYGQWYMSPVSLTWPF